MTEWRRQELSETLCGEQGPGSPGLQGQGAGPPGDKGTDVASSRGSVLSLGMGLGAGLVAVVHLSVGNVATGCSVLEGIL